MSPEQAITAHYKLLALAKVSMSLNADINNGKTANKI